ncbi:MULTISPECIES: hypothetical protein [Pseudonocardia]|uniref:Uncharacterized protein n=2 Tax=Pseudonocardia TaxID=1847 RepID=A0A1Y2MVQ9_PSEAH|nr:MULTISPECIES: hypothetical protein [Pseudonocardia]OSY39211.1 hypothetical protein BG845_03481 [Pseudonocardia autotrophica]TDN76567.1 hypothetical protein C8E95_5778 [Pseudonocardia autotrophica]BBG00567.1 hypothetical protein Pdca_17760 [Pseudonocardia autotrophica]GEC28469.1 hypothetical protein PSA01_54980 [Pseudonocardia saturnea]
MNAHPHTVAGRVTLAVAGAGALLAVGGGLAHADTPDEQQAPEVPEVTEAGVAGSGVPVFLLDGAPALPVPGSLLTPVDLTAPVFEVLDGLT